MTGVTNGVEITTLADIPSAGSGLGSSSAVTVGLLHALYAYRGRQVTGRGTGRARLHDRDRAVREADRQAGPVHRRLRRHPRHPLRPRRGGSGRRASVCPRPTAAPCSSRSCSSTPASPAGRTRSWPSRTRTSRPPCRSSTCFATWPASPSSGCATGTWTRSAVAIRESWEAKRKLASGVSNDQIQACGHPRTGRGRLGRQADRRGRRRLPARHLPDGTAARRPGEPQRPAGAPDPVRSPRLPHRPERAARHLGLRTR